MPLRKVGAPGDEEEGEFINEPMENKSAGALPVKQQRRLGESSGKAGDWNYNTVVQHIVTLEVVNAIAVPSEAIRSRAIVINNTAV